MTRNEKLEKIGLTIEDFYRSQQVSSDLSEVILYSVQGWRQADSSSIAIGVDSSLWPRTS